MKEPIRNAVIVESVNFYEHDTPWYTEVNSSVCKPGEDIDGMSSSGTYLITDDSEIPNKQDLIVLELTDEHPERWARESGMLRINKVLLWRVLKQDEQNQNNQKG